MPQLKKITVHEVANLWGYYFGDDAPDTAKTKAGNIHLAVFGDVNLPRLRHEKPGSGYTSFHTDKLLDTGLIFMGLIEDFYRMFQVKPIEITLDMEKNMRVYMIPLCIGTTQSSNDDTNANSIIVLYGTDVAIVGLEFLTLSYEGWEGVKNGLPGLPRG